MSRAKAPSKEVGEDMEAEALEILPELTYVSDTRAEWHDARVDELLAPPDDRLEFGSTALVEADTEVEMKAAQLRLSGGRRGRFHFRRGQHDQLLDAGAVYLLIVYDPQTREIVAMLIVPASIVDECLPDSWTTLERDSRETPERYCQKAWSGFFDVSTVGENR